MLQFIFEAGPLIFPVLLLAVVVGVLTMYNGICLFGRLGEVGSRRRRGIDSILFWGGVAAVLGLLGQWIGVIQIAKIIHLKGIVSPQAVVYGLSESLLTPMTGMFVLVISGFLWFALRVGLWNLERRA